MSAIVSGVTAGGRISARRYTGQVLLLAGLTWKEGVRRRMILIGFLLTAAFVALYGVGVYYAFRSLREGLASGEPMGDPAMAALPADFFRDLAAYNMLSFGLFITSFLSAMLAVFLAAGMIGGDAENGTLQTIATRPVSRAQILLGRFFGYATIYLAYLLVLTTSILVLNRIFSGFAPPHPVQAVALLALEGMVVLSLVSLGTAALPPLATGVLALMAFGLAFVGGIVQQIGAFLGNGTAEDIGRAVHYLMPSDALFRMGMGSLAPPAPLGGLASVQMGIFGQPSTVNSASIAYGILYAGVCLAAAIVLFRRRDL